MEMDGIEYEYVNGLEITQLVRRKKDKLRTNERWR